MVTNPSSRGPGLARWRRVLLWCAGGLVVAALVAAVVAWWLLHDAEPLLRAGLIAAMEDNFHGRVEMDSLSTAMADGFAVEGRGLRIWLPQPAAGEDASAAWFHEPWITVDKLSFHANWRMHPGDPVEIGLIRLSGARVLLPPKGDRPHFGGAKPEGGPAPDAAATSAAATARTALAGLMRPPKVIVRRIECADLDLVILRGPSAGKPAAGVRAGAAGSSAKKPPLDFDLRDLSLTPDGQGGPMAFSVDMVNPKPIGTVHATGKLGPWSATEHGENGKRFDPGALPVAGNFTFAKADLGSIKGISGHLEARGQFAGVLRRLGVTGTSETPDFRLERAGVGPGVPLTTHFQATVDGTNGNTTLDHVEATLGQSHMTAQGVVARAVDAGTGIKGHDIALNVIVDRGRIEDFLRVSSADDPLMTGNLTLTTEFHLRPNDGALELPVLERLELNGHAQADGVRFTSQKIQAAVKQISLRGQGQPGQVKETDASTIESAVTSHFTLSAGVLTVPDFALRVPGAEIDVHGNYGLLGGTLAFDGDAKMQAPLSRMVGGWKGLLLKPADRFFRKNGAETDVPVHLTGTRGAPRFGVDWDRIGKSD